MIDLTAYRYALIVRDLIYKKQRHNENPNDTRFEWDNEFDLRILQDFSHFLNILIEPSDPNYFTQVLSSVQEIISTYNQTATRNTPSPEIKREYEEYLKKLENPEKKNPLPPILKRLYPSIDDSTLELISKLSFARATFSTVSLTLPLAVQDLRDLGILSQAPSPEESALVALDALSPLLTKSPEFNQILSAIPAPLKNIATLVATSAISGINFVPTDTFPAVLNSRFPPSTSQKISSQALSNQKLLTSFLAQAQAINQVGVKTNYQLARQTFLSGTPLPPADQAVAATVLYNYVFPAIGYASSLSPSTPASFSIVETVFARLGLSLYEKDHGNVKNSIRQAISSFGITNASFLFTQPVQSFYASKYASSPHLKDFFSMLATPPSPDPRLQEFFQSPLGSEIKGRFALPAIATPTPTQTQDALEFFLNFVSKLKITASRLSQEPWFDAIPPALLGLIGFLSFGVPGGGVGIVVGEGVNFFRPGHFVKASNFASSAGIRLGSILAKAGASVIVSLSTALAVISLVVVSIPIVIALILFIINSSALVVPPNRYGLSNNQSNLNFIPPGETVECTTADKPLSFKYDTNPTASAAWSIVNNLKQGFWCYWNNSPDYPELFDQAEYQKYPYHCVYEPNNPLNCSGDYRSLGGYSLFWCTWLIRKVYPTTYPFTNLELGANNMKENWFKSPGKYLPNASGVVQKISPGDTIFLRTGHDSDDYAGHAALVYLVTQDFVFSLDSNASAKTHSYTVSTDGSVQGLPGLTVLGFGKLN